MAQEAVRIFLSYTRKDQAHVERLYQQLREAGFAPWMDTQDLLPGQRFKHQIKKEIRQADFFLACLSRNSIDKRGFIQQEIKEALDVLQEKLDSDIFLIPVRLEDCEVPESLREFHWANLYEEQGLPKLLQAIRAGIANQREAPIEEEAGQVKSITEQFPSQEGLGVGTKFSFETVTVDAKGKIVKRIKGEAVQQSIDLGNGVNLEMVLIPAGTFLMGSPENEEGRSDDESPQHRVTVAPFYMGKYSVTQAQWEAVMGNNPSNFKGANRPVEQVSWEDAQEFCQRLNKNFRSLGDFGSLPFRLPSEAEWEYACRAGTTMPFYFGETITTELANYDGNYTYASGTKGTYREQTTDVGSFPPNAFGLYDMHGNVWEWCADPWHDNYDGAPTDGSVWEKAGNASYRLLRGGSWDYRPGYVRSAYRDDSSPAFHYDFIGLRLVVVGARTL